MTSVIAKAHIQVAIVGIETDVFPGTAFDATADQIAALLLVGAIYPVGTVLPVNNAAAIVSPLISTHGTPSNAAGADGQICIDLDGHGLFVKLNGIWVQLGYLANSSSGAGTGVVIGGTPGAATIGVAYSFTPTTVNGSGTKSFALSGTLPSGLSFSTSSGAITGTPTAVGTTSGLTITVTDTSGSASLGPFSIVVSAVAAPINSVAPTITGTAQVGQTLTVSQGTWTGSPTSYAYSWKRSGSAITGAVSSTYVPVTADIGATLTCTVTATNAGGSASATSAATAVVSGPAGASAPGGGSGNTSDHQDINNAYLVALTA